MTTHHTFGPWFASRNGTPDYAPQYGIYAEHDPNHRDFVIVTGDNAKSDAHLISQAPAMLAALGTALDFALSDGYGESSHLVRHLREAINNAITP